MGIPREPIRLVKHNGEIRAEGVHSPKFDVTDELKQFSHDTAPGLTCLSGYILKRGSPSCGMERVKVYAEKGLARGYGRGIYADILMKRQPLLPVEEEGRLRDPVLKENFIERVVIYHSWQRMSAAGLTSAALVDYHARHKLLIMSHSQAGYRRLGRMVAKAGVEPIKSLARQYIVELMIIAKRRVSRKSHANVLKHLCGYLKKSIDAQDKQELVEIIDTYRRGELPLLAPITLLNHYFLRHPHPCVQQQVYLQPHPAGLILRNAL